MKWQDLLSLLGDVTLFESSMLVAGKDSPAEVRRQISRWVASGRLSQLRRGLYVLVRPMRGNRNWRRIVRVRVAALDWASVVADVDPFLEDPRDRGLLDRGLLLAELGR